MLLLLLACTPDGTSQTDAASEVVVAHQEGGEVLRFDTEGHPLPAVMDLAAAEEAARHTGRLVEPSAVVLFDDGAAWVTDFATGDVLGFDAQGGFEGVVRDRGQGSGRLQEPCAMARDAASEGDGPVAVLGNDSGNVVFVDGDEAVLGVPIPLHSPHAMAWRDQGMWVGRSASEPDAGQVEHYDLITGERLGAFAARPEVEQATAVLLHDDQLLVADFFQGRVTAWDPFTGAFAEEVVDGLDGPLDLEVDASGTLWVLDRRGVWRVPRHGEALHVVDAEALGLGWTRDLVLVR